MDKTRRLIARVAVRQMALRWLRRLHVSALAALGLYAALLLVSRFLAVIPDVFSPRTLAIPLAAGILAALALTRRPRPPETARLIDASADTKDLYLTAVMLDHSMGDFQPIVREQAEAGAAAIQPAVVAPIAWGRPARDVTLALAVLLAGILWLPQWDPFRKVEARGRIEQRRREIAEARKAIAVRAEMLTRREADTALSKEVEQRLTDLQKTLETLLPKEQNKNLAKLSEEQKRVADLWRKLNEEKLKEALERIPPAQQFGAVTAKQEKWGKELADGKADALRQEMKELAALAKKLAAMPEGKEKEKLRQEMRERLKEAAQFAAKQANHAPLDQAMNEALQQLAAAEGKGLDKEALEALEEALKLADLEAGALAQNQRDLKALEEALKAIQMARQRNAGQVLAGGDGAEQDNKEPGWGAGGYAPPSERIETASTNERSRSALQAGKMLMQMKLQEVGPVGDTEANYLERVAAVKQGVSEAILQEQVPAGYHEAISKYFDQIGGTELATPPSPVME